jgi:hypothetical protein
MKDNETAGPPSIERMQKVGELYEDSETGFSWLIYTRTPKGDVGNIVMEALTLDGAWRSIEEAVELDEQGRTVYFPYWHTDGLVYQDGAWRSIEED